MSDKKPTFTFGAPSSGGSAPNNPFMAGSSLFGSSSTTFGAPSVPAAEKKEEKKEEEKKEEEKKEDAKEEKKAEEKKDDAKEQKKPDHIPQVDGAASTTGDNLQEPEYDVMVKLSDIQADPNNPLYSIKSFEELGLSPEILQGLSEMNFRRPSKIQEKALPLLMMNPPQNMIGQSQSGTGKTAAFVLNILHRLELEGDMAKTPQAIVIAPTRELARQIVGVIETMGRHVKNLSVFTSVPGDAIRGKRVDAPIVVGTPGTIRDQLRRRLLPNQHIKVVVLDEADKCFHTWQDQLSFQILWSQL
ncbi:RNA helicase required for poly(A+) mRNA export [Ascosphaera pollenicola]|nr:RNA helicase required for poly(A+) mRNA export [Ascosphaera pollenicola]